MIDAAFTPSLLLLLIPSIRGRETSASRSLLGRGLLGIESCDAGEERDLGQLREARDAYLRLAPIVRPVQANALNPEVPRGDLARRSGSVVDRATGSRAGDRGGTP